MKGIAIGGFGAGAHDIHGAVVGLLRIKVIDDGSLTGFCASAFNHIKGRQAGFSIGIINYAHELNGIQLGLINYIRDNPGHKLLPVINFHFE